MSEEDFDSEEKRYVDVHVAPLMPNTVVGRELVFLQLSDDKHRRCDVLANILTNIYKNNEIRKQ